MGSTRIDYKRWSDDRLCLRNARFDTIEDNRCLNDSIAYNNSGEVIAELNGSNQAIANYVWGPDRLLAKKEAATGKNYLYLYNGHGDVVQIIDPTGQVVNDYQYDEWGNILSEQEQIQNSFKYAGEILDEETGYYYLRARYYDPMDGRFISKDTYEGQINNPLSLNLYTYVANNPLIFVDPSGNLYQHYEYKQIMTEAMGYKSTKEPDKVYQQAWNILSRDFKTMGMSDSSFKYLFGLLTQTRPYANNIVNANWAKGQLLKAYDDYIIEEAYVNAIAGIGNMDFRRGIIPGESAVIGKIKPLCNCFIGGTKVLTDEGGEEYRRH